MDLLPKKGGVIYPALFLFSIFLFSIFKIKSYDLWWHIKAGELIAGAGFKPAPTNTFSWTEPDHPWINFSWLFDVIVYLIHGIAGFNGLIIFQAVLVTSVFSVVYKTIVLRTENPPQSPFAKGELPFSPSLEKRGQGRFIIIAALFLIAYFAARFRFSLRPHLLALLFFAIDIYLLSRLSAIDGRQSASSLSLWERVGVRVQLSGIIIIQVLWSNVHGSAILGVLLPTIFAVESLFHPLRQGFIPGAVKGRGEGLGSGFTFYILLVFAAVAASLLNPYRYKVLTDPFMPFFGQGADLFNVLTVDEWQMPPKDMFLGWYGLLLALGIFSFFSLFIRERSRVRVGLTDLLLFSLFAVLSIKAVRFIDLFAIAAIPVIYRNISGSCRVGCANGRVLFFSILALFWSLGIRDITFSPGLGVDKEFIPERAAKFMEKNGIHGEIFNSYNSGGYLIYKGYPVFMDGRLCYSQGLVKEFADANLTISGWKMVEGKYRPEIVMMEYDKPSIPQTLLSDKQNWALVYWDDLTMLFLKRSEPFSDIISKNEYRYLNPMDMYGRGGLPSTGGRVDLLFWEEAIFTEAQKRIKDGPDSMRSHLLLGNLYLNMGEIEKAAAEYKAVIDSPLAFGKAEAHNNLGTAYERLGDIYMAELEYKTAARLDRDYPLPQKNLGYLDMRRKRYIQALWHLERYLLLDKGDKDALALVSKLKIYRDVLILRVFIGGGAILGILWVAARRFNDVRDGV